MKFLTAGDLKTINEKMTRLLGGSFYEADDNVFNENALEYLVEIVQSDFMTQLNSNIPAVAAGYYVFNIIKNHIFHDGNKRTGLMAARHFLRINGYTMRELTYDEIVDIGLKVESGETDREGLINWFKSMLEPPN